MKGCILLNYADWQSSRWTFIFQFMTMVREDSSTLSYPYT